jgi:hypothetical protein
MTLLASRRCSGPVGPMTEAMTPPFRITAFVIVEPTSMPAKYAATGAPNPTQLPSLNLSAKCKVQTANFKMEKNLSLNFTFFILHFAFFNTR